MDKDFVRKRVEEEATYAVISEEFNTDGVSRTLGTLAIE